jgi:hypothetical protein
MDLDEMELKATKNREKTADELFIELGYEKKEYGTSKILYAKELDFEGYCIKSIWFDKVRQLIRLDGFYDIEEIQAINKKVEELGWK